MKTKTQHNHMFTEEMCTDLRKKSTVWQLITCRHTPEVIKIYDANTGTGTYTGSIYCSYILFGCTKCGTTEDKQNGWSNTFTGKYLDAIKRFENNR